MLTNNICHSFKIIFRFVTKSCHVAIIDVKDCVTRITVVTVQEQETGNVPVDKLVSIVTNLCEFQFFVIMKRCKKLQANI